MNNNDTSNHNNNNNNSDNTNNDNNNRSGVTDPCSALGPVGVQGARLVNNAYYRC